MHFTLLGILLWNSENKILHEYPSFHALTCHVHLCKPIFRGAHVCREEAPTEEAAASVHPGGRL